MGYTHEQWEKVVNMGNLLIGEYTHTLDDKKRVSLPKAFRQGLGRRIVMTRGLDKCLVVFSPKGWERMAEKLQSLSFVDADTRGFNRFMLSGAAEVDVDAAGRILIPDHQMEYANLKKEVVFAGISDHVEAWDASRWQAYKAEIERDPEGIAKKLSEIGAL